MTYKTPVSVLVVVYRADGQILLLERAAHPGYWQSVTGSIETGESLATTARREVCEETGIVLTDTDLADWQLTHHYEIFTEWRHRYAPGVTHNEEHVFSAEVPANTVIHIAPEEHRAWCWKPWREAAEAVFSWSNRDAIRTLAEQRNFP